MVDFFSTLGCEGVILFQPSTVWGLFSCNLGLSAAAFCELWGAFGLSICNRGLLRAEFLSMLDYFCPTLESLGSIFCQP